ncbi:MAG TPA: hypothetical protein VMI31_01620, partial [Fimbriimonadaceae bacterium]|nr:hypothetical protein [Fimbriimonadaceae bacterium]
MRQFQLLLHLSAIVAVLSLAVLSAAQRRGPGRGGAAGGQGGPPAQMGATGSLSQPTLKPYEEV